MKILNIVFKNINSLEGESRIHFDQSPIADSGVFAITGANGSGKTSVLDAITLALYGETFRFNRPADHVMTKSAAESFAQVEFSLGKDVFRSSWHVKRENDSPTGAMQTPEMKLFQLNGQETILEDGAQKVRGKMAALTGMDFHKFTKSMILAQGDFAAFLNALDSERMDILEKISGVDIYQDYKEKAETKFTEAQTLLKQLEQDLAATPVMDSASIESTELDLADFKLQRTEFEAELDAIQKQLDWIQSLNNLERQLENLAKKEQQEQERVQSIQQQLQQIEANQEAMAFEGGLGEVDQKTEKLAQSKKTLNGYRLELEMLQKQLKEGGFDSSAVVTDKTIAEQKNSLDALKLKAGELKLLLPKETALLTELQQHLEQEKQRSADIEGWIEAHSRDRKLLDEFPPIEKLLRLRRELSSLSEQQKADRKWVKNIQDKLKKTREAIKDEQARHTDLTERIESDEASLKVMAEGLGPEELESMQLEQQERVENFRELYDLAGVNSKLNKKAFFTQLFNLKTASVEETELKVDSERLQLELGKEQKIVETLELTVTYEGLLKKMQPDRVHLIDGKACPLCGALEHPYSKHEPAVSDSKQVLAEQRKKVKKLTSELNELTKQIASVHKQAEIDNEKDSKLELVRSQWSRLSNRLNVASEGLDIDNLSLMRDLLKREKNELNKLTGLLKKYNKQVASIEQAKVEMEVNEAGVKRLTSELAGLEEEWNNRPQESVEKEQYYEKLEAEEKALSEKVSKQLSQLGEKMPVNGKDTGLAASLKARKQEYLSQLDNLQAVVKKLSELETNIQESTDKIAQINNELAQCSSQSKQEEMVSLHLSLVEKQKIIAEKEMQLETLQQAVIIAENKLAEQVKNSRYDDIKTLKEAISQIKKQPEVSKQQVQAKQTIESLQNKQQNLQQELETERQLKLTEALEEQLLLDKKSVKEKLDIAKQEVISIGSKLSKQQTMQERHQQLLEKIAGQKAEVEACETDIKLISDENGMAFRRKVQHKLADKLLAESNQILEKISGRYYVRKVESEHGLALQIEDTKQNNVRRLPKSLSGGESFIVSLALALALAEMANSNHALDSLFLDEGFGNLDAESLYLVMTTLESLKTHGKVVGIISHVEGVRNRIKTQIEMIKKPNGLSALKMVS